jgi:hypothetical protein
MSDLLLSVECYELISLLNPALLSISTWNNFVENSLTLGKEFLVG